MRLLLPLMALLAFAGCDAGFGGPRTPYGSYPGLDGKPRPGASWVPMAPSERWIFSASWNGIPVGTACIECVDVREVRGRKVLHVACTVQPNGYIEAIYHLRDEISSDIDLETGLPLRFTKHIEEGSRLKDEYIEFDHAKRTATYFKKKLDEGETEFKVVHTMEIPEGIQDPLSSLLRLRALALKEGVEEIVKVGTDEKVYDTHVQALARQPVYLPNFGDLKTVYVQPILEYEGIFPNKGRLDLWMEEETRAPVKLQVEIKIGLVQATLVRRDCAPPIPRIPRIPDSARIGGRAP